MGHTVLILIVVDNGLVLDVDIETLQNYGNAVLILIVVDNGLVPSISSMLRLEMYVLILIVVDNGLVQIVVMFIIMLK